MRTLAIRAAVNATVKGGLLDPPVHVCVPCGSSHGDWFPGEAYTMHGRLDLTPWERELT